MINEFCDEHKALIMKTSNSDQKSRFDFTNAVERTHVWHGR